MGKMALRVVAGKDISPQLQANPSRLLAGKPKTKANAAMAPTIVDDDTFLSPVLQRKAYYADERTIILNMDVSEALQLLKNAGMMVNCIVTSPPFYGQRD